MKTIYLILAFAVITFNATSQDEKFSASFGTGVGVYGGSTNETGKKDTTLIDAACALINVTGEYMFAERLFVGFLIERNGFLTNSDSSERASSLHFYAIEKYRFVDNENNKLYVGIAEGYSYLTFSNGNTNSNNHAFGTGYCLQVGAGWEHYFSTNVGMTLSGWYAWYHFTNLQDSNNSTIKVNNNSDDLTLTFSGVNIKAGLVFKF